MVLRGVVAVTLFVSIIVLLPLVSAELQLLCLDDGDEILFSACNPVMEDYSCTKDSCQVCVDYNPLTGVYCPRGLNTCTNGGEDQCSSLDEEDEVITPENSILLTSPSNDHFLSSPTTIQFTYSVEQSFDVDTCSLMFNGQEVLTSSERIQSQGNEFSYVAPLGEHIWSIQCEERTGGQVDSPERTLRVGVQEEEDEEDDDSPAISLTAPASGYRADGTQALTFSFDWVHPSVSPASIASCRLLLNTDSITFPLGSLVGSNSASVAKSVSPGAYTWRVRCLEDDGTIYESSSRSFSLQSIASDDDEDDERNDEEDDDRDDEDDRSTDDNRDEDDEVEGGDETVNEDTTSSRQLNLTAFTGAISVPSAQVGLAFLPTFWLFILLLLLVWWDKKKKSRQAESPSQTGAVLTPVPKSSSKTPTKKTSSTKSTKKTTKKVSKKTTKTPLAKKTTKKTSVKKSAKKVSAASAPVAAASSVPITSQEVDPLDASVLEEDFVSLQKEPEVKNQEFDEDRLRSSLHKEKSGGYSSLSDDMGDDEDDDEEYDLTTLESSKQFMDDFDIDDGEEFRDR